MIIDVNCIGEARPHSRAGFVLKGDTMGWNGSDGIARTSQKVTAKNHKAVVSKMLVLVSTIVVFIIAITVTLLREPKVSNASNDLRSVSLPQTHAETKEPTCKETKRPRKKATSIEEITSTAVDKPEMIKRELTDREWNILTNRTFDSGVEQMMGWVFSTVPGQPPMPIPRISDEDRKNLVGILLSPNNVKDGDSENVAFRKQSVALAKKEMMKYIRDGGDPDEFLKYYHNELKLAYEFRFEAERMARKEFEESGAEAGRALCEKINEKLSSEGILLLDTDELEDDFNDKLTHQ